MARPIGGHAARWRGRLPVGSLLLVSLAGSAGSATGQYPSGPQIAKDGTVVLLQDDASLPLSSVTPGSYPPSIDLSAQLARVNFLRSEPASAPASLSRFFVSDSNRSLYILNKADRTFTPYLNFEEIFPRFDNTPGYSGGLVTFAFDPDYGTNGKFFTVHLEDPARSGSAVPTTASLPGFDLSGGYATTSATNPPAGTVVRQAILVEWSDTDIGNSTFQGTAREVLRVGFTANMHPMGDVLFNPMAHPGDPDYGNLYVAIGDGGSGELPGATHSIPQRLDALQGKILRITPDVSLRTADLLSSNGRYRIPTTGPDPNPFMSLALANVKKEIYAYGFRNPHRMSWDPVSNTLIVNDIGLNAWEEVDLVTKGANYGYAEREGAEQLFLVSANRGMTGSQTSPATPFPNPDSLVVAGIAAPVTPVYPVIAYSHQEGDALGSGFVYRGSLIPQLYGRYIFSEISTGRIFYADLAEMRNSRRDLLATIREIQVVFNIGPGAVNRRLYDIVASEYAHKGGDPDPSSTLGVLPGFGPVVGGFQNGVFSQGRLDIDLVRYGGGRADIRVVEGGDGEIYVLSKSDGMIRRVLPFVAPSAAATCALTATPGSIIAGGATTIGWTTANAQTLTVAPSLGVATPAGVGSQQTSPASTTTYTATVTGSGGDGLCAVTVTVTAVAHIEVANIKTGSSASAGTFIELPYTVPNRPGQDLVLVVSGGGEAQTTNAALPVGATFTGRTLTAAGAIRTLATGTNNGSGIYWTPVKANETGTIRLSFTGTLSERGIGAMTLVGAALTGPTAVRTAAGTSSLSDTITTTTANALVVTSATQGNPDDLTATGTGHARDLSVALPSSRVVGGHVEVATPGAATLGYSGTINRLALVLAAFPVGAWVGPGPVATPTFSPGTGTYSSPQTVTISTTTAGASLRYTTDGSAPTSMAGTVYGGPVAISTTTTVRAIAYQIGVPDSAVAIASYTITPPPPVDPGSGVATAPPTALRVDDVVDPVGIGNAPYFGWFANDPDPDEIQTQYQVLVASSRANLDADIGDIWNSGGVASRLQNHVAYAGAPLTSDTKYYWKVRTWDKTPTASPYSATATFVVGLLANADWSSARWIKRNTTIADDYTYYRKSVTLPNKTVQRATVYITSVHKYALYVNGVLVGKGPSYHYPQYQYYNAYDITSRVTSNTGNLFAIFNHWFGGGQGRPASSRGVLMKAIVRYTDGTTTVVGTDSSWRQRQATSWVTGQSSRNGEGVGYVERLDARNLVPNWFSSGFSDSSWSTATDIGAHPVSPWTGTLAPDLTRITETEIAPVGVIAKGGGKYVVDLGKVYAGVPRIAFSGGTPGGVVNMRGGYALNAAGEIDTTRSQSTNMSYVAVLSGGSFSFEPAEYLGMRYFQVDNAPMTITPSNFTFVERHNAMDATRALFASPNPPLNAVWDLMKHSLTVGAQEAFVDTPTREKGGFLGDGAIQSVAAMPVMAERVLTRKSLNEFIQSMAQYWSSAANRGRINAVYPNNDGARDIPDYTQAYLAWVWEYYLESGDRAFLSTHYSKLKDVADYVERSRSASTGLVTNLVGGSGSYQFGIVDWPAPMRFGYDMTAARTVINGWAYADNDIVSRIAAELGNTGDRDIYRARADAIKAAINGRLLDASGVYVDGVSSTGAPSAHVSQHANMFPLALGIVPGARVGGVIAKVEELDMSVGMVTVWWLVRALGEADRGPALVDLYTNTTNLGWARSLSRGATATWESWTADSGTDSQSHAWGAAGLYGFVRYILGVTPLRPQHEQVRIKPLDFQTALPAATGRVPTDRGDISVAWDRDASRFFMSVTLPVNVSAVVYVPKAGTAGPSVRVDGVDVIGTEEGAYVRVSGIGSGTHTFERAVTPP